VSGGPPLRATRLRLGRPRGSPCLAREDASRRLLQPTYESSTRGPFDSRAWWLSPPERASAHCASRAPGHLAAIRTSGRGVLDGTPRASAELAFRSIQRRSRPVLTGCLTAAFSTARPAGDRPLTLPFALRPRPWHSPAAAGALGSLPPSARQSARVSRPEASFLDRCPSRPAFAVPFRARHRSRGFATDEPASGAPSLPVALARGARPGAFRLSPEGIHGRAPPVDFCNRDDPRPQPRTRSNPAHRARSRLRAQLVTSSRLSARARSGGWPPSRKREKPTEIPQLRGERRIFRASHRDRSRRGRYPDLYGSDTSCREQVVAQAWIASATGHDEHAFLRAHPDARRLHSARLEGPLLVLSREGERDTPHPRCLPSMDAPVGG
jgi:hypothetical protein